MKWEWEWTIYNYANNMDKSHKCVVIWKKPATQQMHAVFSIYKKYKNWQNYFMMLEVRMVIKPGSNVVLDRGTRWSSGGLVMPFFVCTQNLN